MRELPETIEVPVTDLDPYILERARAFGRYRDSMKRYALEDALRDGTATMPQKIKAAWDSFGDPSAFEGHEYVVRCMAPQVVSYRVGPKADLGPVKYETIDFYREVTRNKDFTVTRIHSGGLTVYEKVEAN